LHASMTTHPTTLGLEYVLCRDGTAGACDSTGGGAAEANHRRGCSLRQLSESCDVVRVNFTVICTTLFPTWKPEGLLRRRKFASFPRSSGSAEGQMRYIGSRPARGVSPPKPSSSESALQHSYSPHHLHAYIKPHKRHGRQGEAKGAFDINAAIGTTRACSGCLQFSSCRIGRLSAIATLLPAVLQDSSLVPPLEPHSQALPPPAAASATSDRRPSSC
jgi:hypothetical protein